MQIACPACAATYEFDERRVGPEGIALRCSACGHLFQYARLEAAVVGGLRVRRVRTGEVSVVPDEQEVRRAILERRFDRGDLISRSGQHWAPLGESPAYAPYFRVVDEMGPVRPAAGSSAPARSPGQTRDLDAVVDFDVAPSRAGATRAMNASGATPRDVALVAPPPPPPPLRPAVAAPPRPPQAPATSRRAAPDAPAPHPARPRLETAHLDAANARKADRYTFGGSSPLLDDDTYELGSPRRSRAGWDDDSSGLEIPDTAPVRLRTGGSSGSGLGPAIVIGVAILASTILLLWFAVPGFRTTVLGQADPRDAASSAGAPTTPVVSSTAETEAIEASGPPSGSAGAPIASPAPGSPAAGQTSPAGAASAAAADPVRDTPTPGSATGAGGASVHPDAPRIADLEPVRPAGAPAQAAPAPADSVDVLLRRGNDALGAGNLEGALAAFSDAAERFDRAEAHVGMARTFARMGRDELALTRYERATRANARYQPAWLEYGDMLRERGDTAGAIAAYERVLSIRDMGTAAERARTALSALRSP